jgi:hypothetical protein
MSGPGDPASASIRLTVGQARTLEPHPRLPFIPTGVTVMPGERYRLSATGQWKDWFRLCGAEGWKPPAPAIVRRLNRVRGANTFLLCASIGQTTRTARPVGLSAEITITVDDCAPAGQTPAALYVFANDWACMYWNNKIASAREGGPMILTIERTA